MYLCLRRSVEFMAKVTFDQRLLDKEGYIICISTEEEPVRQRKGKVRESLLGQERMIWVELTAAWKK